MQNPFSYSVMPHVAWTVAEWIPILFYFYFFPFFRFCNISLTPLYCAFTHGWMMISLFPTWASSFRNGLSLIHFSFHHDFSRFTLPLFLSRVNGFCPNVIFMVGFVQWRSTITKLCTVDEFRPMVFFCFFLVGFVQMWFFSSKKLMYHGDFSPWASATHGIFFTVTHGDLLLHTKALYCYLWWFFLSLVLGFSSDEWFDFSVMMVGDGKNRLICDSSTFLRFFISLVYIPLIQQLIHLILSDGEIFDLCCQQMGYVGGDGF